MSPPTSMGRRAPPLSDLLTQSEQETRVALAACYRLMAHFRMSDTIYTHLSARLGGDGDHLLINPFGLHFEEITASSLIKVSIEGDIIDDSTGLGINRAGFIIHSAIHEARPDIDWVFHSHSVAGAAVSAQRHGLLPISQHAQVFIGRIAYHDHEGISVIEDERARLISDFGDNDVMILRNHGLLVGGRTPGQAMFRMLTLERACQMQIAALAGSAELVIPPPEVALATQTALASHDFGLDWSALMRLAYRIAPGFDR